MPKPPKKPPILLQQRLPFQGQGWEDIGAVWEFGDAQDALTVPVERPYPGTILRAVERRHVSWAGVADGNGSMLPIPRMALVNFRTDKGVSTWFHAWDGPKATYRWMLSAAARVDRALHVSVALSALALLTPMLGPDEFSAAVSALRAWLRGEGSEEAVKTAEEALYALDRSTRYGGAEEAATSACRIVTESSWLAFSKDAIDKVDMDLRPSSGAGHGG